MANRTKNQTLDRDAVSPDRVDERDDEHYLHRLAPRRASTFDILSVLTAFAILTSLVLYAETKPIAHHAQIGPFIHPYEPSDPLESFEDQDKTGRQDQRR